MRLMWMRTQPAFTAMAQTSDIDPVLIDEVSALEVVADLLAAWADGPIVGGR